MQPQGDPTVGPDGAGAEADSPQPHRVEGKTGLTLGFVVAGLLVILYAAQTAPVLVVPTTAQLGLVEVLPPLYWAGIGLLAVSVALAARSNRDLVFVLAGLVLLGIFAATPALFEPNPPVWDAYIHYAASEDIIRVERIPTDPSAYAANWPGFFLITAAASLMGGLAPLTYLAVFPLFSGALTFLTLFLFLRAFFPASVVRPASVLSSALCVWAQYHVSPQGIGLALALLVLATAWDKRIPLRVANAILFIGLVVSHATSAIFVLAFFGVDAFLALLGSARGASRAAKQSPFALRFNPFLIYGALWLGWLFFVAGGSAELTESMIVTQFTNILKIGETTANVVAARSVLNIYVWAPRIRLGALAVFGLAAVVGLLLLLRKKELRAPARFLIAAMSGLGILAAADITLFKGLFYDRSLIFFSVLAPAAFLWGLRTFHLRPSLRRAIFVVLLVTAVAAGSTTYYQEPFYFVTAQSVAVSNFLSTHGGGLTVYDGEFPLPIWLLSNQTLPWDDVPFYTVYPDPVTGPPGPPGSSFAVFDQTAMLWYIQGHGIEIYQFYGSQRSNYSLTYDNGYAQIYMLSRPPGG